MKPSKILIVSDSPKTSTILRTELESAGFLIDVSKGDAVVWGIAPSDKLDGIILSADLPQDKSLEFCKQIKNYHHNTPVLMISALSSTDDTIKGFEAGADDYLVKPYESRELIARLKSIIKRSQPSELKEKILSISDLILNTERKTLTRGNKRIPLTVKEYELLEYLLQNKGKIVSKSEIAENIWQTKIYSNTNVIEVYINFLRKKIDKTFSTKLIRTHVGIGYELKED